MEILAHFKEVLHPNSIYKAREYQKNGTTDEGHKIVGLTLERGNVQELTVILQVPGESQVITRVHDLKNFTTYEYVASAKWTGKPRKR